MPTEFLSKHGKAARSDKASASGRRVQRALPFGAGLGDGASPQKTKAAEPLPVQPRELVKAVNPLPLT
jgi:hypothetical protein